MWRLFNWAERAWCIVRGGHQVYAHPGSQWAWCVRCTKKWKQ